MVKRRLTAAQKEWVQSTKDQTNELIVWCKKENNYDVCFQDACLAVSLAKLDMPDALEDIKSRKGKAKQESVRIARKRLAD